MINNFQKIKDDLVRLSNSNNLFHAYLFFGESVEDIFDFSKMLANFLENGEFKSTDNFLNDFSVIKPNEHGNIGIEEMREMQKFLYRPPVASKRRFVVIYGASALTDEAQGGILKIIEEPPQKSLLILIASQGNAVLDTIQSRVNKVYFSQKPDYTVKSGKKKTADSPSDTEEIDEFFRKNISDLGKNPEKNFTAMKEVLKRLSLMKQFNLNNKLQMRLLNLFLKKK